MAIGLTALPWPVALLLAAVIGGHACWRQPPRSPPLLVLTERGSWYVAGHGGVRFVLGARPLFGPSWVRLELRAAAPRRVLNLVLLADQLDEVTWRRLLARLRCAAPAPSLP